jgi:hypothetical protein
MYTKFKYEQFLEAVVIKSRSPIVKNWIKKLKSRGIDTYIYRDLPDDLKDLRGHRKAIIEEAVERIDKKEIVSRWKIKE